MTVHEVQVLFDRRPLPSTEITANLYNRKAVEGSRQLQDLLVAGFRDRFPSLAAKYGLVVTAGASYQLDLRSGMQRTDCSKLSCWSRVILRARLLGPSPGNKELWTSYAGVGMAVGPNSLSEDAFDPMAEAVLQAMKKDGFIAR